MPNHKPVMPRRTSLSQRFNQLKGKFNNEPMNFISYGEAKATRSLTGFKPNVNSKTRCVFNKEMIQQYECRNNQH